MNWEFTKKSLIIFIPNYGRANYIRTLMCQFNTVNLPRDDWGVLVGNDGLEENLDDLIGPNFQYFTLPRNNPNQPRNGAFIRNYYLRHSLSKVTIFKDPETIIKFDDKSLGWLNVFECTKNSIWRPAYNRSWLKDESLHNLEEGKYIGEYMLALQYQDPNNYARIHWAYGIMNEILKSIGGYREEYKLFGPEDRDLYIRLNMIGYKQLLDKNCYVGHLWHPLETNVYQSVDAMEKVFSQQDFSNPIANIDREWGQG